MRLALFALMTIFLAWPLTASAENPHAADGYQLNAADKKKFNAMSSEEQDQMRGQATKKWQEMSSEDRKDMEEQARENFYSKTPEEQEEVKAQALKQWQGMTPEEQKELKEAFPDLLQGELELDNPEVN